MSSTSSSDHGPRPDSATEILASRYRHLFVLPSSSRLLIYLAIATFVLVAVSDGVGGAAWFIPAVASFVLAAGGISKGVRAADKKTIATFRRVLALLFAGVVLWLLVVLIGGAYGLLIGSRSPATNALLFGAFLCAGIEFLVINGAFLRGEGPSLALAVLHPASTLFVVSIPDPAWRIDHVTAACGVLAFALMVAFPVLLKRRKTTRGHDALGLFRAFMKTWAGGDADDLEKVIADHSEEVEVVTKVLRFRTAKGDTFLVLPGVHPGPFHPVGSYDLPGVMARTFGDLGRVMTLHRPGGHERNLATRAETERYAAKVREAASSVVPDGTRALVRGPLHARVAKATVSSSAFADDAILTISFAPLGSDDLDTSVELELAGPAAESGLRLSVVDAHNSIDVNLESPRLDDQGWRRLFAETAVAAGQRFSVAYCHSSEVGFKGAGDVTENGIGMLMVQAAGLKSALILADANNAVPELRGMVEKALDSAGYSLIELCTSDSHNLAARGLTVERGYEALGEATPPASIAELAVKMAKLAESKAALAEYGSSETKTKVRVFGARALEEFAKITQSSSAFSRAYLRFALVAAALLFAVSVAV